MKLVPCAAHAYVIFPRISCSSFKIKYTELVTKKNEFRMQIETIKMYALRFGVGDVFAVSTCIGCRQKIDLHGLNSASGKCTYYACSSTSSIICWVPSLGSRVHSTWWAFQSFRWQNVEQYGVRRHNEHSANASRLQFAHWIYRKWKISQVLNDANDRALTFLVVAISTPGIWWILFGSSTSAWTRAAISAASRSLCIRSICLACKSFTSLKYLRKSCVALVIWAHIAFKRSNGTLASAITANGTKSINSIEWFFLKIVYLIDAHTRTTHTWRAINVFASCFDSIGNRLPCGFFFGDNALIVLNDYIFVVAAFLLFTLDVVCGFDAYLISSPSFVWCK